MYYFNRAISICRKAGINFLFRKIILKIVKIPKTFYIKRLRYMIPVDVAMAVNLCNKKISYEMIKEPLVLISQLQRSGGTLLSQLFDGHPQLYSHPNEIMIGKPEKWDWIKIDSNSSLRQKFISYLDEYTDRHIEKGYSKYGAIKGKQNLPFNFSRRKQYQLFLNILKDRKRNLSGRDCLNAYFTSYFNAWENWHGWAKNDLSFSRKYITGFTPRLIAHSRKKFFYDYPDGFIITIIRDPRAWYASAKKHDKQYFDINQAIDLWKSQTKQQLLARKETKSVIVICFEDLVNNTAEVMREIAKRIGIEWDDILLYPTFNAAYIESDSSFKIAYGIVDTSVTKRFKNVLSENETRKIEDKCFPLYNTAMEMRSF